ncbi:MAG: TetR/AcrR family transcriptional regulator [Acidimicrobiia bacterium]|nr:TetR/AcrR family transcriptional regulator [Acidimicrobiia bacterium]
MSREPLPQPPSPAPADAPADTDEPPSAGRILEAAEACFARYGFQKTSMEDIAREAGLSRRSVYRHFPDKAALFNEVAAARTRIFLDEIMRRTAVLDGLSAQIEEVARLTNRFIREDPISAALRRADPDSLARMVSTEAREMLGMAMEAIVPLIETARDRGEVRADLDVMRSAEWIARMVFSLSATPGVTFDIADPEQTAAFIREFLLPGLC